MTENKNVKIFKRMMYNMLVEFAVPLFFIFVIGFIMLCIAYPYLALLAGVGVVCALFWSFWEHAKTEILDEENGVD